MIRGKASVLKFFILTFRLVSVATEVIDRVLIAVFFVAIDNVQHYSRKPITTLRGLQVTEISGDKTPECFRMVPSERRASSTAKSTIQQPVIEKVSG